MLVLVAVGLVFLVSVVAIAVKLNPVGENLTWGELFWRSVLRALDGGTMAADTGMGYRAAMFLVTVLGIVLVASITGIVSNSLAESLERLRRGKSLVLENNHTVILGWNSKAVPIISELVIANKSRSKAAIVIFAEGDKTEIEEEIKLHVHNTFGTRVIVRNGNPMSKIELRIAATHNARSVIILSPDFSADADSFSIKTCLALQGLEQKPDPNCSIVGEIRNSSNLAAAELVGESRVRWIMAEELINRLIVQSCRQGGLSGVFTDMLDFDGSEIYLMSCSNFAGKTYREANLDLKSSIALGVMRNEDVSLNPEADLVLTGQDFLVVLAEDDTELEINDSYSIDESTISIQRTQLEQLDSTLVLGINRGIEVLLAELEDTSKPGSKVTLVSLEASVFPGRYKNLELQVINEDPTVQSVLSGLEIESYNHIVILASRDCDVQRADAKTLLSLLHVRALTKGKNINIVSEILDDRNRELVETDRVDDFIVSDKLVSHAIAQLAENTHLYPVFEKLFSSKQQHIKLKPIDSYVKLGESVHFATVIEAAHRLGESAIGYRSLELKAEPGELHGVRLNPSRNHHFKFQQGDSLVVLSHEH
jgi:Trk K+ transport system NAD-binding subunit